MNSVHNQKNMHPFKKFLIELLSVRAGLYINQEHSSKR